MKKIPGLFNIIKKVNSLPFQESQIMQKGLFLEMFEISFWDESRFGFREVNISKSCDGTMVTQVICKNTYICILMVRLSKLNPVGMILSDFKYWDGLECLLIQWDLKNHRLISNYLMKKSANLS